MADNPADNCGVLIVISEPSVLFLPADSHFVEIPMDVRDDIPSVICFHTQPFPVKPPHHPFRINRK